MGRGGGPGTGKGPGRGKTGGGSIVGGSDGGKTPCPGVKGVGTIAPATGASDGLAAIKSPMK